MEWLKQAAKPRIVADTGEKDLDQLEFALSWLDKNWTPGWLLAVVTPTEDTWRYVIVDGLKEDESEKLEGLIGDVAEDILPYGMKKEFMKNLKDNIRMMQTD
jgi:hypothetical protein